MGAMPGYDLKSFETDLEALKPRFFDTWILPGFLIWYAMASKDMKKRWRRALFTAGVWAFYRNYSEYKAAITSLTAKIQGTNEARPS